MDDFLIRLRRSPIIGALRASLHSMKEEDFSLCAVFFLLESNILEVQEFLPHHVTSPFFFLHLDLFGGIASDESGLCFIRNNFPSIRGIISTRARTLALAKKLGFFSILRLFCIDSESLKTGLRIANDLSPDAVELLPGLIFPKIKELIPEGALPPIICGGLIRNQSEVQEILHCGAVAISTSHRELWKMNLQNELR